MDITNYVPANFDPDKFHALKCLWLYNRKSELFVDYLRQVPIGDFKAFKKLNPMTSSIEQLQRETGLSIEDIYQFSIIGGYVSEILDIINMTPEEFKEYIDTFEADVQIELDPEHKASIEALQDHIIQQIQDKNQMRQQFRLIINENFND